jgi:hypothetical protein
MEARAQNLGNICIRTEGRTYASSFSMSQRRLRYPIS